MDIKRVYDCDRHVEHAKKLLLGAPYTTADDATKLPPAVDLRSDCTQVYDQGQLGACTGFASAHGLLEFLLKKTHGTSPAMSPLYVYYYERVAENTVNLDAGAQICDAIAVLLHEGCATEATDPYYVENFKIHPSTEAEAEAGKYKIKTATHLHTLQDMKHCLASGNAFIGGISVYASFESEMVARTGNVPMPQAGEEILGGHAITIVGYNDQNQTFIMRNSWSSSWGVGGYCLLSYAYIQNYGSDFWTATI
jgi:C1A family cysteine protease